MPDRYDFSVFYSSPEKYFGRRFEASHKTIDQGQVRTYQLLGRENEQELRIVQCNKELPGGEEQTMGFLPFTVAINWFDTDNTQRKIRWL